MITIDQNAKIAEMIKKSGICLNEADLPEWMNEVLPRMERDENGALVEGWEGEAQDIIAGLACGGCH